MRKSGKVINIQKNKVYILTSDNDFVKVKKHKVTPVIGETYIGETFYGFNWIRCIFFIVLILSLFLLFCKFNIKNKSSIEIVSDMNCSIKLNLNTYNEIVQSEGISVGGIKICKQNTLDGKSLNDGLCLILNEAIKNNYLTKAHADDGRKIVLFVCKNEDKKPIDIKKFKKYALSKNFNVVINNNAMNK